MNAPRTTYANVAATLAVVTALGSGAYAAGVAPNSVGTAQLKNSAVTGEKIKNSAITSKEVARGAVQSRHVSKQLRGVLDERALRQVGARTPLYFRGSNQTIQQIDGTNGGTHVADVTLGPAGSYLLQVTMRAFPRQSDPGDQLSCLVAGFGGAGVSVTNALVSSGGGITNVVFADVVLTATDGAVGDLRCEALGGGQVTVSYEWFAVRVQSPQ